MAELLHNIQGFVECVIDETGTKIVYLRLMIDDDEYEAEVDIFNIPEESRVDLSLGSFITVYNGVILVDKSLWTTFDMEQADREAKRLYKIIVKNSKIISR